MQIIKIEPFKIIGISVRTINENNQAAKEIGELWSKFMSEAISTKIPNKGDDIIYSLYTDYEGDHTKPFTTILGCKVESLETIPQGMIGRSFDGGTYVKFTARGDLGDGLIVDERTKIWERNLDRKYTVDFEVYGEKAHNPKDAEVDFFVAVN